MTTQAYEINKITYRRKTHDKGIILGTRPWRWTLGAKYSPVIDYDGGCFPTKEQREFARWVNHTAVFNSVAWEAYKPANDRLHTTGKGGEQNWLFY